MLSFGLCDRLELVESTACSEVGEMLVSEIDGVKSL